MDPGKYGGDLPENGGAEKSFGVAPERKGVNPRKNGRAPFCGSYPDFSAQERDPKDLQAAAKITQCCLEFPCAREADIY
jgi:hypothetical protein